jgi:hypothetical protein
MATGRFEGNAFNLDPDSTGMGKDCALSSGQGYSWRTDVSAPVTKQGRLGLLELTRLPADLARASLNAEG